MSADNETIVARVADALYESHLKRLEERASLISIPSDKVKAVFQQARMSSARSSAILVFALIDDLFEMMYKQHLNSEIKGGLEPLFRGFGLLSTSHSRIVLAAALRWIKPSTHADIDLLRKIRNVFAHQVEVHSFEDEPVRGLVQSLTRHEAAIIEEVKCPEPKTVADAFLVRSAILVVHLIGDLALNRDAQLLQVSPHSLGFDRLPDSLKTIHREAADFTLRILWGDEEFTKITTAEH